MFHWAERSRGTIRNSGSMISPPSDPGQAESARALIQHALACPNANLLRCGNFRAELQAHLGSPGAR